MHLSEIVGVCNRPLVYVVCEQHEFPGVTRGNLLPDQPHSEDHEPLELEMIILTSHDHPLFRNYNGDVYDRMEWALSGSQYAPTIFRLDTIPQET